MKILDKSKNRREDGITLIALVITIIVLLILAAVSIAMLTGENGILSQASKAAEETRREQVREKVQLEVLGSYDNNGNLDMDKLKENIKNNLGVDDITDTGSGEDRELSFELDGYEVTVDSEGNVIIDGEVVELLKITKNPSPITTAEGNTVTFSVQATGRGTINYQWYYNTEDSTTGGTKIDNATTSDYSFTATNDLNGRYYYCVVTLINGNETIEKTSETALLTVGDANYSITSSGKTTYYNTLALAHAAANSGDTIVLLKDITDNSYLAIEKSLTIDLNNHKLTKPNDVVYITGSDITVKVINGSIESQEENPIDNRSNAIVEVNNVNLNTLDKSLSNIYNAGGGIVTATRVTVNDGGLNNIKGTLKIIESTINDAEGYTTIANYGELIIESGKVTSTSSNAIKNNEEGNVTIKGGTVSTSQSNYPAIWNNANGNITVENGEVTSTSSSAIKNNAEGNVTIKGGTVSTSQSNYAAIWNNTNGNITVENGEVTSTSSTAITNNAGGMVTVTGGKVTSTSSTAITNKAGGMVTVTGGKVTSTSGNTIYNTAGGTITVTGGTVSTSRSESASIYNNANGTITIGDSSVAISTSNPNITGMYGVSNPSGTFNFYNGILRGTTAAYYGNITTKRSGATLTTGTSGSYKTAYYR